MAGVEINMSFPQDWTDLDLTGDDARKVLGDASAAAIERLRHGGNHVRLLLARALSTRDGDTDLAVSLIVTLTPASSPGAEVSLNPADYSDEIEPRRVSLLLGRGIRRWSISALDGVASGTTVPALTVQYLIGTEHGLLTMTFTTAKRVGDTDRWDRLFGDIAQAAWLVPEEV